METGAVTTEQIDTNTSAVDAVVGQEHQTATITVSASGGEIWLYVSLGGAHVCGKTILQSQCIVIVGVLGAVVILCCPLDL